MNVTDDAHVTMANGVEVSVWVADDGETVVQIDTPVDSDIHETIRVYVNDGRIAPPYEAQS